KSDASSSSQAPYSPIAEDANFAGVFSINECTDSQIYRPYLAKLCVSKKEFLLLVCPRSEVVKALGGECPFGGVKSKARLIQSESSTSQCSYIRTLFPVIST